MVGHGGVQTDFVLEKQIILHLDQHAVEVIVYHTRHSLNIGYLKSHTHSDTLPSWKQCLNQQNHTFNSAEDHFLSNHCNCHMKGPKKKSPRDFLPVATHLSYIHNGNLFLKKVISLPLDYLEFLDNSLRRQYFKMECQIKTGS